MTDIDNIPGVKEKLDYLAEVDYVPGGVRLDPRSIPHAAKYRAIFTNPNKQTFKIDREWIDAFPNLKFIATASTGTNHIDKVYAASRGIQVLSLTERFDVITQIPSTAEHAFTLMMMLLRNVSHAQESVVKHGVWDCERFVGYQLKDLTVGVIGLGRLGTMFRKFCESFGARVLYTDIRKIPGKVSIDELLSQSNVVSLHVHLDDITRHMVNDDFLSKMKESTREFPTFLINTSRGEIVDETSVAHAISSKRLGGYATDVLESELSSTILESPIVSLAKSHSNVIVTPHIGGMTHGARKIAYNAVADMLKDAWIQAYL